MIKEIKERRLYWKKSVYKK